MHNFSLVEERHGRFVLRTVSVAVPDLPAPLHGFRIAHLTDLHYGPATPARHLAAAVSLVNTLGPDLIVLTGDYIQNTRVGLNHRLATSVHPKLFGWMAYRREVRRLAEELSALLEPLEASHGIIGIFGNHDYAEGVGSIRRKLPQRIRWLTNSAELIRQDDATFLIAGVDDFRRGRPDLVGTLEAVRDTIKGHPAPAVRILLSHNPDIVTHAERNVLGEFDLALCGHTHGGQIRVPLLGAPITRTRQRDHTSLLSTFGTTTMYVNHGVGYGTFRIRLFCPPEIALIELRNA